MNALAVNAQRATPNVQRPTRNAPADLSDAVPISERVYVVRYRNGDYLVSAKRTDWQTVKWLFTWTADFAKARRFTWTELFEKGPEALSAKEQDKTLAMTLVVGYASSIEFVRVR